MNHNTNKLEMAKKRDHKVMITEEAINKIPRIKYRDIPESEYDKFFLMKLSIKIIRQKS